MQNQSKNFRQGCLDEINAAVKATKKPLTRKTYLAARRWYRLQVDTLKVLKYRGKIPKLNKHRLKKEVVDNEDLGCN